MGHPQFGSIPERTTSLANLILHQKEQRYGIARIPDSVPERAKEVRRHMIQQMERTDLDPASQAQIHRDMDDMFFVIQLYSYPGDYVAQKPSIERIAETLDKFEEDVPERDVSQAEGTCDQTLAIESVRRTEFRFRRTDRGASDAAAELTIPPLLRLRVQEVAGTGTDSQ